MEKRYGIYRKSILTGRVDYISGSDGYSIEIKERNNNIHLDFEKICTDKCVIKIEVNTSGLLNNFIVTKKNSFIKVNDREIMTKQNCYLFLEMLFNYDEISRLTGASRYKNIQIFDDSYRAINLYKIFEIDNLNKLIINPIPAKLTLDDKGMLKEYIDANDYKIVMDKE